MAGWKDLAVELIMNIVSLVDEWGSLSLTSSQLHTISQPFMYRSVNLFEFSGLGFNSVRIFRFLRTLAMQPQLGERVRHLEISYGEGGPIWTEDPFLFTVISEPENSEISELKWTNVPDADISFITEISQRVGIPEHLFFGRKTSHIAVIASILHHVPRLQSLYFIGVEDLGLIPTMIALGMVPGGVPAALRSIVEIEMRLGQTIYLEREESKQGWLPWQSVIPFIMLPNMKRCRFEGIAVGEPEFRLTQQFARRLTSLIIPSTSIIERLHLITCNIPADGLQTLLSLSSGLREFSYVPEYIMMRDTSDWYNNDYPPLASRLRDHAESLTSLQLHNALNWSQPVTGGVLGSLTGFTTLRHLDLDIMALYSHMNPEPEIPTPLQTLLPASLITLELWLEAPYTLSRFIASTGCPDNWATADDLLPNLKKFILHLDGTFATQEEYTRSAEYFEIAGIDLEYEWVDDW